MLQLIGDHLWQSTVCVGVAWLLTLALRKNHAGIRFWVWFAASMKFLAPFSALVALGALLPWRPAPLPGEAPVAVFEAVSQPFSTTSVTAFAPLPTATPTLTAMAIRAVPYLWALGTLAVLLVWLLRWRRVAHMARSATATSTGGEYDALVRLAAARGITPPVLRVTSSAMEPAIVGVLRPALLWPAAISDRLTSEQRDAVLAHELAHVARRDNLLALLHMAIEALFWFHPLVWVIGARLVHEREHACDEEVVRTSGQREAYAEGILRTCEHFLESTLPCASGVTGADLKGRVAAIMRGALQPRLGVPQRVLLTGVALLVLGIPLGLGAVSPTYHAVPQQGLSGPTPAPLTSDLRFEVASVKPNTSGATGTQFGLPGGGRFTATNATARELVRMAYSTQDYKLVGLPDWTSGERFDIEAMAGKDITLTGDPGKPSPVFLMLRSLLAERFGLTLHAETRDMPVYVLSHARADRGLGPRLAPSTTDCAAVLAAAKAAKATPPGPPQPPTDRVLCGSRYSPGRHSGGAMDMEFLSGFLSNAVGRTVVNSTGLTGRFDWVLEFRPDSVDPTGGTTPSLDANAPSLLAAVQEQLGLKLDAGRAPVEVLVIDRIERPAPNDAPEPKPTALSITGQTAVQSAPTPAQPRFEVASVKPTPASAGGSAVPVILPGRLEYRGATLKNLIAGAYESQVTMILEMPGYEKRLNDYRFNIEAKTNLPQGNPREQFATFIRPMLKELLAERFKLRLHPEVRETRAYALVVGKNGPRFKAADPELNAREIRTRLTPGPGRIVFDNAPLTGLANTLAGMIQVPVVDRTGLTGVYNFTWQWILDNGEEITPAQAMENLGLKLEDAREPVRFIVIDHAEMPTEN